jgi:hypothetical protein
MYIVDSFSGVPVPAERYALSAAALREQGIRVADDDYGFIDAMSENSALEGEPDLEFVRRAPMVGNCS